MKTFKKELNHLVEIDVLAAQQESEWASPSFITPKKDGRVCWISYLRQLNKIIRRKQYPLLIIMDILRKCSGYKFFTKLDVSMQYYMFELDEKSQDLCTFVTQFGKYKYLRLPMGLKCLPDIAQAVMENVLSGIKDADVYIGNIGAFSDNCDHHLNLIATFLWRLCENGITINPPKCEWAIKETDWLGYWLTPQGLKPWKKKIDAILRMDCPCNTTELRMFIGCINYYRDMWPSRAHILTPLTNQSSLKTRAPIKWTYNMQQAFDKMRLLMAANDLAAYPNHNKRFDVFTDASDFQLGACIIQEGRPVAYFSQKLTKSQKNYTTMEKEMLSIVPTLKEFQRMLLGANIHVFTDHKNLTFDTLKTQRVLCWHTKIKEFSPMLHYIKGPCNILADNLSRLHHLVTPAQIMKGKEIIEPAEVSIEEEDEAYFLDQENSGLYNEDIWECIECYLNLPDTPHLDENPLNCSHICELQQQGKQLLALQVKNPDNHVNLQLDDDVDDIICYKKDPTQPN